MILSVDNGNYGSLFDANGTELLYAVWADTESGEVCHLVKDEDGKFEFTRDDSGREVVRREWRQHPAPLKYRPPERP